MTLTGKFASTNAELSREYFPLKYKKRRQFACAFILNSSV